MQVHRHLAVVYTVEEALCKVNYLRELGFLEHEIHIFARNIEQLHALKMYSEIDIHQSGNVVDLMKSLVSGSKLHETCLKRFGFSSEELQHYGEMIRKGAIFLIAQHDFPVEKQPTKYKGKSLPKKLPAHAAHSLNATDQQKVPR